MQGFHLINAIAATISPAEVQRLRANPAVAAVVPDSLQHLAPLSNGASPAGPSRPAAAGRPPQGPAQRRGSWRRRSAQQVCPSNPAKPLIEPEARALMNVDAANRSRTAPASRSAVLADGIDPDNPDLIRPNGQHVIFDYQDFSGQGPTAPSFALAAFLNAGLIGAQGNQVYDLSKFVNPAHPLPPGCNIKIEGIAPGASVAELNCGGNANAVSQLPDHPDHPVRGHGGPRQRDR